MNKRFLHPLLLASSALALTSPLQAAWSLVDDFESYNTGDFETQWNASDWNVIVDAGNSAIDIVNMSGQPFTGSLPNSQALTTDPDGGNLRVERLLSNGITEGSTGTLFYQFATRTDQAVDLSVGLDDTGNTFPFSNFAGVTSSGLMRVRDGGGTTYNTNNSYLGSTLYNVWLVFDNNNDVMRGYYQLADSNDAPVQWTRTDGMNVISDFAFIAAQHSDGTLGRITFQFANTAAGGTGTFIDNIYFDPSAQNLTNPIPEPTVAALGLLGSLALLRRRR